MHVQARMGDTLTYYSQLFMVPLQLLRDSNPGIDGDSLANQMTIHIPGFNLVPYRRTNHIPDWQVAQMFHLLPDALLLVNPLIYKMNSESIYIPKRVIRPIVKGKSFYDSGRMEGEIGNLLSIYPFVQGETIGNSVNGHPLRELSLGNGPLKVHINASFHANEWITTAILMQLLNTFLLALTNQQKIRGVDPLELYQRVTLSVVPMVNPDGVNLVLHGPRDEQLDELKGYNNGSSDFTAWKANIRGVDLNNQYPAHWEIEKQRKLPKAPAPRDFPGNAPLTEPEAIAMAQLAKRKGFHRLLAFHTQGEEFYWGYEGNEPPISIQLADEFARVSGYQSVRNIDSHAGYKDWFIQEFNQAGFTIELGKGINPLPLSQFNEIYEEMLGIFLAVMYM